MKLLKRHPRSGRDAAILLCTFEQAMDNFEKEQKYTVCEADFFTIELYLYC